MEHAMWQGGFVNDLGNLGRYCCGYIRFILSLQEAFYLGYIRMIATHPNATRIDFDREQGLPEFQLAE